MSVCLFVGLSVYPSVRPDSYVYIILFLESQPLQRMPLKPKQHDKLILSVCL